LKTLCTTLVPMPSFLPILRLPSALAINSSIRASTEGSTVTGGAEGETAPDRGSRATGKRQAERRFEHLNKT
jgi:hypothetical protein